MRLTAELRQLALTHVYTTVPLGDRDELVELLQEQETPTGHELDPTNSGDAELLEVIAQLG